MAVFEYDWERLQAGVAASVRSSSRCGSLDKVRQRRVDQVRVKAAERCKAGTNGVERAILRANC